MNILFHSPDNGVTRNFMPHLRTFLLKSLTPPADEVFPIDGNAQPMTPRWSAVMLSARFAVRGIYFRRCFWGTGYCSLEEPPPLAITLLRGISGSAGAR